MKLKEVRAQLQELGTEQNRKVYQRHGYGSDTYGVSFANLAKLKRAIKTDHELAQQLWQAGNTDERCLATMIAAPELATSAELESWVKDLDVYVLSDLFASYVGKTSFAKQKAARWCKTKSDWIKRAGWDLYTGLALRAEDLNDEFFRDLLSRIEKDIHRSSNFARHAMNNALIAIGVRNASLRSDAIAAARRIGEVVVDHGQTSCKTPDAEAYILKTVAYRASQEAKRKAKKSKQTKAVSATQTRTKKGTKKTRTQKAAK